MLVHLLAGRLYEDGYHNSLAIILHHSSLSCIQRVMSLDVGFYVVSPSLPVLCCSLQDGDFPESVDFVPRSIVSSVLCSFTRAAFTHVKF